jgi:hypothetical protein
MNNNGTGLVLASLALADHPRVMRPVIFTTSFNIWSQAWSIALIRAAGFYFHLMERLVSLDILPASPRITPRGEQAGRAGFHTGDS